MNVLEIFLVVLCVIVCVVCAVTDLKSGKIKNMILFPSMLVALCLNLVDSFQNGIVTTLAINVALMSLISMVFYFFHFWGAGDSKFLIFIAMAMPVPFYENRMLGIFPLVSILIYIFIIAFVWIVLESIVLTISKKEQNPVKVTFKLKPFLISYVQGTAGMLAINQVMSLCFPEFLNQNWYCVMLLNFFVVSKFSEVKHKLKNIFLIILAIVEVIVITFTEYSFVHTELKMLIFLLSFLMFKMYIDRFNYKEVSVEELEEGMVLDFASSIILQGSNVKNLPTISTEDLRSKLSNDEIQAIQKWSRTPNGKSELTIVKKFPFGLFMSIGTILYIIESVIIR